MKNIGAALELQMKAAREARRITVRPESALTRGDATCILRNGALDFLASARGACSRPEDRHESVLCDGERWT